MDFSQFHINKSLLNQPHFKEKNELRWFNLKEIASEKVLFKLKKTILKNFE